MKTIKFNDISGAELTVQHSSSVEEAYRIYIEGVGFEPEKDKMGNEIPRCIHVTRSQAEILIAGLQDLFRDNQ